MTDIGVATEALREVLDEGSFGELVATEEIPKGVELRFECLMPGYTDWHWQVLYELEVYNLPSSYLEYLFERISGLEAQTPVVNFLTGLFFGIALIASLALNYRDYRRKAD